MSTVKRLYAPNAHLEVLSALLRSWAESQDLVTKRRELDAGSVAIQCRQRKGDVRNWIGMDVAFDIELFLEDSGGLHVKVADAVGVTLKRWAILLFVLFMTFGLNMLWPLPWLLFIPVGLGFWFQRRAPERVFQAVQGALMAQGTGGDHQAHSAWNELDGPGKSHSNGSVSGRASRAVSAGRKQRSDGQADASAPQSYSPDSFVEP